LVQPKIKILDEDGGIFNLRRLAAKSKITELLARDLLYADDCALAAHSLEDAQTITDCFARAAKCLA